LLHRCALLHAGRGVFNAGPADDNGWSPCTKCSRSQWDYYGYSVRGDRWRYTEWVAWNKTAEAPEWGVCKWPVTPRAKWWGLWWWARLRGRKGEKEEERKKKEKRLDAVGETDHSFSLLGPPHTHIPLLPAARRLPRPVVADGHAGGQELYDHQNDFGADMDLASEKINLAHDLAYAAEVAELSTVLHKHFQNDA